MTEVQSIEYEYYGDFGKNIDLLKNLKSVKEITIIRPDEDKTVMDKLRKLLPNCKITWNGDKFKKSRPIIN